MAWRGEGEGEGEGEEAEGERNMPLWSSVVGEGSKSM
jgi:hypothetical protein